MKTRTLLTALTALAIAASAWAEPANVSAQDSQHVVSPDGKWSVFVRFRPKTTDSEGDVLVDPELLEIFRGYFAQAKSDFVIESDSCPDNGKLYHYRCQNDIQDLIAWLRSKGVTSKDSASHASERIRKMLRHADVAVTAAHYVENKQRSVLGFGHLLKGERTIIPMDESEPQKRSLKS